MKQAYHALYTTELNGKLHEITVYAESKDEADRLIREKVAAMRKKAKRETR